jgi:multidrug efflux pump subunit AcrB
MWLVWLALRRPYTIMVVAVLIVLFGGYSAEEMPTDMFPEINIPVVSVVWNYTGISADDMEKRIVFNCERAMGTIVNNIEHVESNSLQGVGVVKVFFHEGTQMSAATAEVTALCQTILRAMPPGTQPPLIIRYSASNVPILQASLSSQTLSESQLFDLGFNVFRLGLSTVQGAQMPYPYGGRQRAIMVDLDLDRLNAYGLSAGEISAAFGQQSLILPAGDVRMGASDYGVAINSNPAAVADFNNLPLKTVNGTVIYVRDVAWVHDGYLPQTSMVHVNGKRSVLMPILKAQGSSTLDVVSRVRTAVPSVMATMPKNFNLAWFIDQSVFVKAAVVGVVKEAAIAACLTGLMILVFLGSWRSTLITVISIPLSILVSVAVLAALGESLNLMTLGGLALAVGILVDDATVTIENIHRNLGLGKKLVPAIVDGAQQIAVPAFVSTLCICVVFVPVAFITGAAKYLFVPLAMAVVFAMLTSYVLSRTLVPAMVHYLLPGEHPDPGAPRPAPRPRTWWRWLLRLPVRLLAAPAGSVFNACAAIHGWFNRGFEATRQCYGRMLATALHHRFLAVVAFTLLVGSGLALFPFIGHDFFPTVDAGQLRMHMRCPPGTRVEQSERHFAELAALIRRDIPPEELDGIIDNIGIPNSGINLSLGDPSMVSQGDGEVMVKLVENHRVSSAEYMRRIRADVAREMPGFTLFALPADISSQILNFGISAPIDIQVAGAAFSANDNERVARAILARVAAIPGAVDVHRHQIPRGPAIVVDVDRTRATQGGQSQATVASSLLTTLSSSAQASPQFWLDPARGVQYTVAIEAPIYRDDQLQKLGNVPVGVVSGSSQEQVLSNVSSLQRGAMGVNHTHYDVLTTFDVLANVDGTDLGSVAAGVDRIVADALKDLPAGSRITVLGQVKSMDSSFRGLAFGMIFAVILVYLLLVVNFQSWIDPLIILGALPGALSGILWMLFLTHTHISVPALMGAIMSIGVATANSILMVSFANDQRHGGEQGAQAMDATPAALLAGMTRLRPVLMTALAMVIGMLPMSLGLSEGGEQNAPLGRAVIGGLALATVTTLFLVPVLYSLLRRRAPRANVALSAPHDQELAHG